MYRERTSSGQTSVITPNQLYRRRFRFCFIGNNFLSILEKRSSFLEKGFKAWLNFTPPNSTWFWFFGICSTEYSTKYSMKYENQKKGIYQKIGKTAKISIFSEYGIILEYFGKMAKQQKCRYFWNMEHFKES